MENVEILMIANGEQVREPWIWKLSKNFNIKVNIVSANIDECYGECKLNLIGPVEEIQRATAWLLTTGIHVQAKERALGVD